MLRAKPVTDELVRRGRRAVLAGIKWEEVTMSLAGAILAYKTARDVARSNWKGFNWKEEASVSSDKVRHGRT